MRQCFTLRKASSSFLTLCKKRLITLISISVMLTCVHFNTRAQTQENITSQFNCFTDPTGTSMGYGGERDANSLSCDTTGGFQKFIRVNVHWVLNDDGTGNFRPNDDGLGHTFPNGYDVAEELINTANEYLRTNQQSLLPFGNSTPKLPIGIGYVLNGVYFDKSTLLNNIDHKAYTPSGTSYNVIDYTNTNNLIGKDLNNTINIYMIQNPNFCVQGDCGQANGLGGGNERMVKIWGEWNRYDYYYPFKFIYLDFNGSAVRCLMHEIGHLLSLKHAWCHANTCGEEGPCCGDDGCEDTPPNLNCKDLLGDATNGCEDWANVSNNLMDYNVRHPALTPCQIDKVANELATTSGNNYVYSCSDCVPAIANFNMNLSCINTKTDVIMDGRGSFSEDNYYIEIYKVASPTSTAVIDGTYFSQWYSGEAGVVNLSSFYNFTSGYYRIKLAVQNNRTDGTVCNAWDEEVQVISYLQPNSNVSITNTYYSPTGCFSDASRLTAIPTPAGTYRYLWSNGESMSYNYITQPSTYSVTTTDIFGCTASAQIIIEQRCNSTPPANAIYWQNNKNTSSIGSSYTNSNPIVIAGTLNVDNDFTFLSCPNILLCPGATINVEAGKTLTINNSKLQAACDEMWNGIVLNSKYTNGVVYLNTGTWTNAMLKIDANSTLGHTTIKDAKAAIQVKELAGYNIRNCAFENCHEGIVLESLTGSLGSYLSAFSAQLVPSAPRNIRHSVFTTVGSCITPYQGELSEIGIRIGKGQTVTIGPSQADYIYNSGNKNVFNNLHNGIVAHFADLLEWRPYSKVTVQYNQFQNIISKSNVPYSGKGVYAEGGTSVLGGWSNQFGGGNLTVTGLGENASEVSFDNMSIGVGVKGRVHTKVQNTKMQNCLIGTSYEQGNSLDIVNNHIAAITAGILTHNNTAASVNIHENNISAVYPTCGSFAECLLSGIAGVWLDEVPSTGAVKIENNTVTGGQYGIYAINLQNAGSVIGNNTVHPYNIMSKTEARSQRVGIYAVNCRKLPIQENRVVGFNNLLDHTNSSAVDVTNPLTASRGISLDNSTDCEVACNLTVWTGYGLDFYGDCRNSVLSDKSMIRYNQMFSAYFGIALRGASPYAGGTFGAQGSPSETNANGFVSDWLRPNLNIMGHPLITTELLQPRTLSSNVFFHPQHPEKTSTIYYRPTGIPPFAEDPFNSYVSSGQGLIGKIPVLQTAPAPQETCGNGVQGGLVFGGDTMTILHGIKPVTQGGTNMSSASDEEESDIYTDVYKWMDDRRFFHSVLENPILLEEPKVRRRFLDLEDLSAGLTTRLEARVAGIIATIKLPDDSLTFIEKLRQVKADLENIPAPTYYEKSYMKMYRLYIKQLLPVIGVLSESEKAYIRDLAGECVYVAGPAVYLARGLNDSLRIYSDDLLCKPIYAEPKNLDKLLTGNEYHTLLYPNPANNSITIDNSLPLSADLDIKIYNINGQLVQSETMKEGYMRQTFELSSNMANGVYVVSGTLSTGISLLHERLVVVGHDK